MRWLVLGLLAGCSAPYEGETPGDCTDGADNDRDGAFDCLDQGCLGAPVCNGKADEEPDDPDRGVVLDPDTDAPDDTEPDPVDDGPQPFIHAPLNTVSVQFSIAFDLDQLGDNLCPVMQICDCVATYSGTGTFLEGEGTRATFVGDWRLDDSDCTAVSQFNTIVWNRPANPAAHHTFEWSDDGSQVITWIVHRDADKTSPLDPPSSNQQWWMDRMDAPCAAKSFGHVETDRGSVQGLITIENEFVVDATFE
jgi:hypothetical protein